MTDRLTGRTVVVTGAGSGIGAAIARGIVAEGGNAVLADLDLAAAESVAAELGERALAVRVDVADRAQVAAGIAAAVARFGRIDAYFNNAGVNQPMNFLDVTEENFMFIMRINALGVLIGTQEAAKQFLAQGPRGGGIAGKVVNTASIAGRTGFAEWAPYSAAKAGLLALTRSIAIEYGARGIRCNSVAPGPIDTPLLNAAPAMLGELGERLKQGMVNATVMRRIGQPEEVAATIAFLASDEASGINGEGITVALGSS